MRSAVLIAALACAGCGPSFQEADAIYKDEVAKLKALQREWREADREAVQAARSTFREEVDAAIEQRLDAMRPVAKRFIETESNKAANAGKPDPFRVFALKAHLDNIAGYRTIRRVDDYCSLFDVTDDEEYAAMHIEFGRVLFRAAEAAKKLPGDDKERRLVDAAADAVEDQYGQSVTDQAAKVKQAYKARDAAK